MFTSQFNSKELALAEGNADSSLGSSKPAWVIRICALGIITLMIWSYFAVLDEVSKGTGKIVPSSREQVIQSLEGGILSELSVREGDIVKKGQKLAVLDPIRFRSSYEETASRVRTLEATVSRLNAEVNNAPLNLPASVRQDVDLTRRTTQLYNQRRNNLQETLRNLNQSLSLINQEIQMTSPLVSSGAASNVEMLRLRRNANDIRTKIDETRNNYHVQAREELSKASGELEALEQVREGRADQLNRTMLTAPMNGIVKDIQITTVGGVVQQGGKMMDIVPLEDQLIVEARINPRDIAFIHQGQKANVKITAYESSIYGVLPGIVDHVSPDSLQDEVRRDQFYYRAFIRTESNTLKNKNGKEFAILPGMMAEVDVKTGQKTVWQYLVKPFNKAQEALRER